MTTPTAPTLRVDWQARRQQLLDSPALPRSHVDLHVGILDYLLSRYGDAPEAAQPARYPLQHEVELNQRAVLVHHYLGGNLASGVKNAREAEERVTSVLQRMSEAPATEESAAADADEDSGEEFSRDDVETGFSLWEWHRFVWTVRLGASPAWLVRKRLASSQTVPRAAVRALFRRLDFDEEAADLLGCCGTRHAAALALCAWRNQVAGGRVGPVTVRLERHLVDGGLREAAHDELRMVLGDESPAVRIRAVALIAMQQDLHDIGLLMDLQRLPEVQADPQEHAALAAAVERLARRPAPPGEVAEDSGA